MAKKTYDTEKAQYLDDATKLSKIGREQALKNWENYAKTKYTGYSEDGKKIAGITALGSPAFQDYETDRNQYHALLGDVTSSAKASGYRITTDPTTGLMMMVNRGGNIVRSNNIDNLNLAIKGMKDKWISPTGEGRKWADAAGWDPAHTNYRIDQDFSAMKKISNVDNTNESYDFLPGQKTDKEDDGGFEKIPFGTENTSGSTDLEDRIKSIGGKSYGKAISYSWDVLTGAKPQAQTVGEFNKARSQVFVKPEDVLKGGEIAIYKNAKNQLSKTIKDFNKLSVSDQNNLIAKKASKDILTFSPIVIKPTSGRIGELMPSVQKGTDINSVGNSMLNDAIGGSRVLYDVETGEKIDIKDVKSSIKAMQLYGIESPHNLKNQKMNGATSDQKVSPIIATITDDDGNKRQVFVSRTGTEMKDPSFIKLKSANSVFNGIVNNMNTRVRITEPNSNHKGSFVKYDSSISDGAPIIIEESGKQPYRMTLDDFQKYSLD